MVPRCEGCRYERSEAEAYIKKGFHVATAIGREFLGKGHYAMLIVNDNGTILVW